MSAMLAALKKKKAGMAIQGDHQDMGHGSEHADDKSKDLHSLVSSLSESEKSNLKTLLNADQKGTEMIAKGKPSSEEKGHIQNAMDQENQETALEEANEPQGYDSDDLAKSMLDSRHLGENPPTGKPRNLGERMKMSVAAKLKGKGKI